MIKTSVFLTVFFFLGILLGFFVGSRIGGDAPSESEPSGDDASARADKPPTTPVPAEATPAPTPHAAEAGALRTLVPPDDVYRQLEAALAAIPVPDHGVGEGRISGHVRSDEGDPVAGVLIRAVADAPWRDRDYLSRQSTRKSLGRTVLDSAWQYYWENQTTREGRTDEDGSFTVAGLDTGKRYNIRSYKDGWEFETAPGSRSTRRRPGTVVDFIAQQVVEVTVEVALPDGGEPLRSRIDWSRGKNRGTETWYAHEPFIRLRPGAYRLTARAGDHREYASEPLDVTLAVGEEIPRLVFQLRTRPGIRGRVVFPPGEEVSSTMVYALRYDGRPPTAQQLLSSTAREYSSRRDGYDFSFHDLHTGSYLVGASCHGEIVATTTVAVQDRLATTELHVPPLAREDYLVLWVQGPGGEVIRDASVHFQCGGSQSSVISRADGSYWIVHDLTGTSGDSVRYCYVQVTSETYGARKVSVSPWQESEVVVQFSEPAYLNVTVANYLGSGYEGIVQLALSAPRRAGRDMVLPIRSSSSQRLNDAGEQTFGPLAPGDYELSLALQAQRNYSPAVAKLPVTVRPGGNDLSVHVPRLYSLTVSVAHASAGTQVQIRPAESGSPWWGLQKLDERGQVRFEHLAAGKYQVSIYGTYLRGQITVEVPAPSVVLFEPTLYNAQKVYLRGKEGYLVEAGFRSGDLIIGIDGVEMQRADELNKLVNDTRRKDASLLVKRDGEVVEIVVDLEKLKNFNELGGHYSPASR